jgi:hypothetical protein
MDQAQKRMWEKMQLMLLMQQHFAQLLHLPEAKTLAAKKTTMPFVGEVVAAVAVATARCVWVATSTESKTN